MSNTLTTTTTGEIVALNEERVALITKMCGNGLSPVELELFLHVCKRTGLDPLMKQIHAIKRQGKLTIQTGIGGFQLIADRTGAYAGSDEAIFVEGKGHPDKATVTVYKLVGGVRCPFTHSARWSEFFPGDAQGFMWKKMPYHMLAKVAESLALRKAFPQELSGLYTDEEMDQADHHEPQVAPQQQAKPQRIEQPKAAPPTPVERQPGDPDPEEIIDEPTRKHLGSLFKGSGWLWKDLVAKIGAAPGAKPADLCYRQYEAAVAILSPAKAG